MLTVKGAPAAAVRGHSCADDAALVEVTGDRDSRMPGIGIGLQQCDVCGGLTAVRVELDRLAYAPG